MPLDGLAITVYETGEEGSVGGSTNTTVTVGSTTSSPIYYTIGFAEVSTDGEFGTDANPFQIRTARQLDNIPAGVEQNTYFWQTHDIYSSDAEYSGAAEFGGIFDGRGHLVKDLASGNAEDACTGLFESLSDGAEISNVVLYSGGSGMNGGSDDLEISSSSVPLSFGGIAQMSTTSSSTGDPTELTNCVVAGYTTGFHFDSAVTYTTCYYGGLIGNVQGDTTITNCAAVTTVEFDKSDSTNTKGNKLYFGGLVGNVSAGELKLTNCYAGGDAPEPELLGGTTGGEKIIDAEAYGMVGSEGDITYANCYSWVVAGGDAVGLSPKLFGDVYNYYLSETHETSARNKWGTNMSYEEFVSEFDDGIAVMFPDAETDAFGTAEYTYSESSGDFPYPEVIRDVDEDGNYGDFVHYGGWVE